MRIDDLIRQLRAIAESEGKQKLEDPELLRLIEAIGIKVDAKNPGRIEDLIERIEHLRATSEADVLERILAEATKSAEKNLKNARVSEGDIRRMVREYEEHLAKGLTHKEAVQRVGDDMAVYLERLREIYRETAERLVAEDGLRQEEAGEIAKTEATEQLFEEVKTTESRAVISERVDVITEKLIEDLRSISPYSPDELEESEAKLRELVKEKVVEQVMGETRIEEGLVDNKKAEVEELSYRIAKVLELSPSERTIVEEAVAKIEAQVAGQSPERIKIVTETIATELAKTPDIAVAAEAKKEEIVRVISEKGDFKELARRITEVLGVPEAGAPLVTEAVAVAEAKSDEWKTVKTERAVARLVAELKTDPETAVKVTTKEPQLRAIMRPEIERVVTGERSPEEITQEVPSPRGLVQRIVNDLRVPPEKVPQVNLAIRNASLLVNQLMESNKNEVTVIRAEYIRNQIEQGFAAANGNLTPEQTTRVQEYARFVSDFYANSSADLGPYKKEATAFAENRGNTPGAVKNAWNEVTGISKIVRMPPKQFKAFQEKYFQLRDGLGGLKMPFGVPQSRSLEGLMKLTQEVPGVKNLLALTQKFTNFSASMGNIPGWFLQRIGLEKIGIGVAEKIGGQAMGVFVKHSLAVIAEQGTQKGLMMILNGVLSGGVQAGVAGTAAAGAGAAGTAAAGAGTVAGILSGPIGWVVAGVIAVITVAKPIFDKVKKFFGDLTGNLGKKLSGLQLVSKRFLQENFGKFLGGLMDFGLKVGTFIVGIPTLLAGIVIATNPVIVAIFIGMMTFSLITSINVSALVPRGPPAGVEVYDYGNDPGEPFVPGQPLPTRDPRIKIPEGCPGIWPTSSGVVTQGPLGKWSHRNAQAIDIGVGSVPIMATHDGLARPGGSKYGTYGYYVEVTGRCNLKEITTRYAHMPSLLFTTQKTVKQGEIIGYVDNTGNSTGSHLHYELIGGQINDWLPKPVPLRCSDVYECKVSIP